ncbi:MAG: SUMF1/EgtB/PvdO family nonheme iron enzyme [Phycisphaerae bacterium]|nr:SUMF1/EgtB/PvdO family nonheme iron enzyme [Phycisphaerae bacterium]
MGSESEIDARPPHAVRVTSFYMGKYEVTQDLYEAVIGKNPSKAKGPRRPVERVTWLDAVRFCNALSKKQGLSLCYDLQTRQCDLDADGYRLPTEAEWEYACRAGTHGDFPFGPGESALKDHAWFAANTMGRPSPVGKKRPNAFGLYDMLGNVREWCDDWYDVGAYRQRAGKTAKDPTGPATGVKKVLRGGAWTLSPESCRTWVRYCDDPGFKDACLVNDDCGFRIARRPSRLRDDK